jgi:transposase InsO family protein
VNVSVHQAEKLSLEGIRRFVAASEEIRFEGANRGQVYGWVECVLVEHEYAQQGKVGRGLLRRYIEKMTGLSRAQVTRLIARYAASGRVQPTVYRRRRFPERFTRVDIELLASVDEAHETLSGPATRRILEREVQLYGRQQYARLATISVAHLYNLRRSQRYRERRLNYTKTRPTTVAIGERRKPEPCGQPGYLRLDTVHQGDTAEAKGVYHINAVDEVTQWQIAGATPRISELYLVPLLKGILRQFPFRILGFHTDNGSEFINRTVAELLNKLLIEQTKSRPRQSGDNGLIETKNGAIIRKHMGYGYIDAGHADAHQQLLSGVSESLPELPSPLRPSPMLRSTREAANGYATSAIRLHLKLCWRSTSRLSTCARDSASTPSSASPPHGSDTDAAHRMQQAKASAFRSTPAQCLNPSLRTAMRPARASDRTLADSREGRVGALDRQPIRRAR